MRWRGERESNNIEDRRGGGAPTGLRFGKLSGLGLVVVVLVSLFFGVDPTTLLQNVSHQQITSVPSKGHSVRSGEENLKKFVAVVLAETEDTWAEIFQRGGKSYVPPKLVLFSGAVQSACGLAGSAVGPFYCPRDKKVYLDLSFFEELKKRFGASGDFAQAYVIAHEVGHHVQNQLGITRKVAEQNAHLDPARRNRLSVMVELQADCLAGVWANQTEKRRHVLEEGDIEEGLNAASAVGDDRIQKRTQGYIVPDAFTHGSAAQRVHWFKTGWKTGSMRNCNTFEARQL